MTHNGALPQLTELIASPPGRTGWPWTEETPAQGGRDFWPRLTVVTPSFNQGAFIEETIRSVLLQGYADLEYIIIDGGSTDNSVETIQKYERWLAYWLSEPDQGQADALNKGFHRATGEILAYIDSDDIYLPGAFSAVVDALVGAPNARWLCSSCSCVHEGDITSTVLEPQVPLDPTAWLFKVSGQPYCLPQPGVFWRRSLIERVGPFREDLRYSFDYEYFQRTLFEGFWPLKLNAITARCRVHAKSMTAASACRFIAEDLSVADLYFKRTPWSCRLPLMRQKHTMLAWRTINRCSRIAQSHGTRAARRALAYQVLRDPGLLSHRQVWGAFRRWCGLGGA